MRTVIIDFDGTMVDVWMRYYQVFREAMGFPSVSLYDYRAAKLRYQKDEDVIKELNLVAPCDYFLRKKQLLEEKRFLKEDTLLMPRQNLLAWFGDTNSIVLTKRRNRDNLFFELDYLGLSSMKDKVVVLNPDIGNRKKDWVANNLLSSEGLWGYVVGDTEEDMLVGENPGIQPLFVRSGLQASRRIGANEKEFERIGDALKYIELRESHVF